MDRAEILPQILELQAEPCLDSNVVPFPLTVNDREIERMAKRIIMRSNNSIASYIKKRARFLYFAQVPWPDAHRDLYDLENSLIAKISNLVGGNGDEK